MPARRSVGREQGKIQQALRRFAAVGARDIGFESRATGIFRQQAITPDRSNPYENDAGTQHSQIFRYAVRYIDDPLAMTGMHAVVDLDDGATIVVDPTHGNPRAKGKTITGSRKFPAVETLPRRGPAPLKSLAIKAGLAAQARAFVIENVGRSEIAGRQGSRFAYRLLGLPGCSRFCRYILARRPDRRRGLA